MNASAMPVGTGVLLRNAPHGTPGIVSGFSRGRVLVRWADLDLTTKHDPRALLPVELNGSELDGGG